jgi:hypothetical protein
VKRGDLLRQLRQHGRRRNGKNDRALSGPILRPVSVKPCDGTRGSRTYLRARSVADRQTGNRSMRLPNFRFAADRGSFRSLRRLNRAFAESKRGQMELLTEC